MDFLWAGYLAARPPERVFLGFRHFIGDELMYASFARQSADEGRFFMENRFTAEPHARRYAPLFPWLVGRLACLTGQRIPPVWEEMRITSAASRAGVPPPQPADCARSIEMSW